MRRALTTLIVLFLVTGGTPAIAVGAQIATPNAEDFKLDTDAGGASFVFRDAEGVELATYTVMEVFDPFEETGQGFVPAEGAHPVMVQVQVENIGETSFAVQPQYVIVQDTDGYLWRPSNIARDAEDIVVPDLQYVFIAPGDRVTGMVPFQIPENVEVAAVLLNPESSRLLAIATVADAATEPANLDEVIPFTIPETGGEGEIVITGLEDPFEEFVEGRDPQAGTRYVLLEVTIENTGNVGLDISPGSFVVHDADGYLWTYSGLPREPDVPVPDLASQQLAPGSRVSGVVGFVLPEDVEIAAIVYQPISSRLITLYEVAS
jgi:hypothetical protein